MKRLVVTLMTVLLAVSLIALAGCGDGKDESSGSGQASTGGDNSGLKSELAGTYEYQAAGATPLSLTFVPEGTFSGNAWGGQGQEKKGTFAIIDQQFGKGAVLTFDDGSRETWSIIIANGEMAAVCDSEGNQYMRK